MKETNVTQDNHFNACQLKVEELKNKWRKRGDSEGRRMVSKILEKSQQSNCLIIAILQNKPDLFDIGFSQAHGEINLTFLFETGCLCGSQAITDHLIKKYQYDISTSDNALAYALSTGDANFAYEIAMQVKSSGKNTPGNIYLYNACTYTKLKQIEHLFIESNHSTQILGGKK